MRLSFPVLLAGLLTPANALPLALESNSTLALQSNSTLPSTLVPRTDVFTPGPDSVAAHLEGLAGCYAGCMLNQNEWFQNALGRFTFDDLCGFYWPAAVMWEWARVRGCALGACVDPPCEVRVPGSCDVPKWIYQAHRVWMIEHCKGIRDVDNHPGKHMTGPEWNEGW